MLNGKVGIVTGGSSGIGEAIVHRLVGEGAKVAIVDIDHGAADRMASKIGAEACAAVVGDIGSDETSDRALQQALERWGKVDFLVTSAGVVHPSQKMFELTSKDFDRIMAVNLRGVFLPMRTVIGYLVAQSRPGSIVNIASVAGPRPVPLASLYAASKAGVVALTQTAALEVAEHGIRINSVLPGVTETPLFKAAAKPGAPNLDLAARIPMKRMGLPAEQADAVAWLISDQSSYVTGGIFPIDGGLSLL